MFLSAIMKNTRNQNQNGFQDQKPSGYSGLVGVVFEKKNNTARLLLRTAQGQNQTLFVDDIFPCWFMLEVLFKQTRMYCHRTKHSRGQKHSSKGIPESSAQLESRKLTKSI